MLQLFSVAASFLTIMTGLKVIQDSQLSVDLSKIQKILAIAAGKGGVGKSMVSVNLALALREQGLRVGLLDADVYGPSLQQMLPEGMEPANNPEDEERLLPGMTFGMPFISVAHFRKGAAIVRAPMASQIIDQFLHTVDWGELDCLIVDFPPGTGDIQLSLMQQAPLSAAVVVTTPQVVATLDVRKAMQLFQKMQVPLLGVVENMSYLESSERLYPFGRGGGESLAKEFQIPLLGQIPIDSLLSRCGDEGVSLFEQKEGKQVQALFLEIADQTRNAMEKLIDEKMKVRQSDIGQLEFLLDGKWRSVSLHEIQKKCPCAQCEKGKICQKEVSLLEFSLVGRYAIKIQFSSGCSQGIYPFSLIKTTLTT